MSQPQVKQWWVAAAFVASIASIIAGIVQQEPIWFGLAVVCAIPVGVYVFRQNLHAMRQGTNPGSLTEPEFRSAVLKLLGLTACSFGVFAIWYLTDAGLTRDAIIAGSVACASLA